MRSAAPARRDIATIRRLAAGVVLLSILAWGCAGRVHFHDWVVRKKSVRYRVGPLPDSWKRVEGFAGDVAFRDESTSAVIMANAVCETYEDAPLESLTKHLLIGFTDRRILEQKEMMLDQRAALMTTLLAELDGVDVKMSLCVIKKNMCVYDLSLTSPVATYEQSARDYATLVAGFEVLP